MNLPVVEGRRCGPCTQCCTTMAVGELRKAQHDACTHCSAAGCGIYEQRPGSCRDFRCMWLDGNITDESMRPDLCKVVWVFKRLDVAKAFVWHAFEAEAGALDTSEMKQLVANIIQRNFVLLLRVDGPRRLLGPDYKMAKVALRASQQATAAGKEISINSIGG